ncbi:MAG: dihydrolipoamide acetyltransferase family protein [Pseudomonadota bacterium]
MGLYAIKMPDIGEGIAEVELVEWRVKIGDTVAEDQILADVMTDKATVEIPSPVSGKIASLDGAPGQLIAVGTAIIHLEVEGAGNVKGGLPAAAEAAVATAAAPAAAAAAAPAKPAPVAEKKVAAEPAPARPARSEPPTSSPAPTRTPGDKPIASPAVRNRAWELGIELRYVNGSGPAGRITHEDLDIYLAARGQAAPAGGANAPRFAQRQGEDAIPVIGLRRKIAEKMQDAKRRIPHFSYVEEIDVTELEALRRKINDKYAKERGKLTLLPLLARAVVLAVAEFPQMNARYDDDGGVVVRHKPVHLGIAAQTPNGLMVPVLRHAEAMDLWSFGKEVGRLAEAARTGKAAREELSGSTITISSLGALGGIVTTPVINYPEVAIIGVNRIVERPMFRNGNVEARQLMNLSSSFDHRVVDGMDAAEFIQHIRGLLETPALLFVD